MFHVENMTPEDFPFAVNLANTMNWNMTMDDFGFNAALEPDGCFTLFDDAERAGVATCVSYGHMGWFGNLIVKPEYRHKGAGMLLVNHAVNYLKSGGVETIGLFAYPHLQRFYSRLGFKRDSDFLVLKTTAISSSYEEKLKKIEKQDMPALVELDRRCFGASRQKLLERILLGAGNLGFVTTEDSKVTGFVGAKVFGEVAEVGPLVCHRNRVDSAVMLLKGMLGKLGGFGVWMYVPAVESALVKVACEAGFREEFRVAKMFLGSVAAENCVYMAESLERG